MKFLTREEWENSPSKKDGIPIKRLNDMLDEIFSFISYICETKYLSIEIYGTALTLFHYYTYFKSFKEIDRVELSVACSYLASKVNYRYIKFDEVVALCNELRINKKLGEPKIVDFELDLMDGLGYDINLTLPYHYFSHFSIKFKFERTKEKLVHNLINESYRRPLCLFFHPKTICFCAFYMCEFFEFRDLTKKDSKLIKNSNEELKGDFIQNLNSAEKTKNIKTKPLNSKSLNYDFLANYELIDNNVVDDNFDNLKDKIPKRDKKEFLIGEDEFILEEYESCFENLKNLVFSKINKK